jgi:hypothetical protein
MESKRLDSAAQAAGISLSYINAHGKPQSIGADTKRRLLDAMHETKTDAKARLPGAECKGLYRRQKDAAGGGRARRV